MDREGPLSYGSGGITRPDDSSAASPSGTRPSLDRSGRPEGSGNALTISNTLTMCGCRLANADGAACRPERLRGLKTARSRRADVVEALHVQHQQTDAGSNPGREVGVQLWRRRAVAASRPVRPGGPRHPVPRRKSVPRLMLASSLTHRIGSLHRRDDTADHR